MYGSDRLTQPLLRMKNGAVRQARRVPAGELGGGLQRHGREDQGARSRPTAPRRVGMFGSGQWTVLEGYAANKLMKAGFRCNNIDPNARHCMASAVMGFMRTFGMDEPMGCYDDIEAADSLRAVGLEHGRDAPDPVDAGHRPPARPAAGEGGGAVDLRATAASTWPTSRWSSSRGTDLVILNYIANHIIQYRRGERGFRRQATRRFAQGRRRHRLRPAPRRPAGAEGEATPPIRQDLERRSAFEAVRRLRRTDYTLEKAVEMTGVRAELPQGSWPSCMPTRSAR